MFHPNLFKPTIGSGSHRVGHPHVISSNAKGFRVGSCFGSPSQAARLPKGKKHINHPCRKISKHLFFFPKKPGDTSGHQSPGFSSSENVERRARLQLSGALGGDASTKSSSAAWQFGERSERLPGAVSVWADTVGKRPVMAI